MTKQLSLLIILMVSLFAATSFAFDAPSAPANGWYVLDQSGQMTSSQTDQLNQKVKRISDATHNEFALVLLQSLNGDNIEDAAYSIFNKWGIGKHGLDNGVLIVVALKDHKSRIETGKGVGGEITDLQAKTILDGMRPQLRAGNFYGAFDGALDSVSSLLESRANQKASPLPTPTAYQASDDKDGIYLLIFFGIIVGGGALIVLVGWLINHEDHKRDEESRAQYQRDIDDYNSRTGKGYRHNYPYYPAPTVSSSEPVSTPTPAHMSAHATRTRPSYEAPIVVPVISNSDEHERRAKRQREEREEEDRRARNRREEESSSSSSSSSSNSWDSGSSGGGFDGGSSGGGGASGDW